MKATTPKAKEGKSLRVDPRLHHLLRREAARRGTNLFALANEMIGDGLKASRHRPTMEAATTS